MPTKSERGGAMFELVIWMVMVVPLIHAMLHWSYRISKSESYWAGAALDAHRTVNHQVCLERVEMNARNELRVIADRRSICRGL